jgi:glycosyltransferase involved in cell wall biosynthesis
MITVYTIAFNEEVFIQFMIDHYRSRFKDCNIVVYDNESTDKTREIALNNNCQVISYSTGDKISDSKYLQIKNNCWKQAETDWVLVCDMDELLDLNEKDLVKEESLKTSIIRSEAYNMVNMNDDYDLANIKHGSRCSPYDKYYCFNKTMISEIRYEPGCHNAKPIGNIKLSQDCYKLYHYKCINPDFQVARYKLYESRLSEENKKNRWGEHYLNAEEQIRNGFPLWRNAAVKII